MGLEAIQRNLEARFTELSAARADSGYPLYAIEHGLSEDERHALRAALNDSLAQNAGLDHNHWLAWITAAAEVGYTYDGGEYWRSFETDFTNWRAYEARETIRSWYRRFAREFRGVVPSGAWANHFGIIAFPITHSLVPRYLQRLFISHLSDLRLQLAAQSDVDVDAIGALLRDHYSGGFRRFAQFLEQTELTGRLVLALRDEDIAEKTSRISADTLARVVRDIDALPHGSVLLGRVRRALRDARVAVARGLLRPAPSSGVTSAGVAPRRPARLVGRLSQDGPWTILLAVPNFERALADASYGLDHCRVRFRDTPGWMPGAALRTYARGFTRPLQHTPDTAGQFALQAPNQKLDEVLRTATTLAVGPPWLFHCDEDEARQVEGAHVRPGQSYLLLLNDICTAQAASTLGLVAQSAPFVGVSLYAFALPPSLTAAHLAALKELHLGYVVQVAVEPVGLAPRWDVAADATVWLTSEEPIIHLRADFPVSSFTIDCDGKRTVVPTSGPGVLLSLGSLPIGRHEIGIGAVTSAPGVSVSTRKLSVVIRAPEVWTPTAPSRAGLRLLTAPIGADIDDIMNSRADIEVRGPSGRGARLSADLLANDGAVLRNVEIYRGKLPFAQQHLRAALNRLGTAAWSEAMDAAARVDITVTMDELGRDSLSFAHAIEPIRWSFEQRSAGQWFARLVNESDAEADVSVALYPMTHPSAVERPDLAAALEGLSITPPGALVVARSGNIRYPVVMSALAPGAIGLSDLLPNVRVDTHDDAGEIRGLIADSRLWTRAVLRGHLASIRRERVKEALHCEMAALACGRQWAERWARGMGGARHVVAGLRADLHASPGFGGAMQNTPWQWPTESDEVLREFTRLADVYRVEADAEACSDALYLAFEPEMLRWKGVDQGERRSQRVAGNPALARGAFLAVLCKTLAARAGA